MAENADLSARLTSIAALPSQSAKVSSYVDLLYELLSSPRSRSPSTPEDEPDEAVASSIDAFLSDAVFSDSNSGGGGLVVGRHVFGEFVKALGRLATTAAGAGAAEVVEEDGEAAGRIPEVAAIWERETRKTVLERAVEKVQPRIVSFEEQASALREQLAAMLEDEEDWSEAARVLQGIPLDSGHRSTSDDYKLRIYLRITRLLLEEGDAVAADVYLKRASLLIHTTKDRTLQLTYTLSRARIFDYQRRFAEASQRYHEVSYAADVEEGERLQALQAAVICAVLAPAGPHRSRILATLNRDERTVQLPSHTMLSKMFLDHIIRPHEVNDFEALLQPHQLAKLPPSAHDRALEEAPPSVDGVESDVDAKMAGRDGGDGAGGGPVSTRSGPSTVLDRAVMEHNVLSASLIYTNITFGGLGALLDLSSAGAESVARKMIEQGRLRGRIDQVERVVYFEPMRGEGEGGGGPTTTAGAEGDSKPSAGGLAEMLGEGGESQGGAGIWDVEGTLLTRRWDQSIRKSANAVEEIVRLLREKDLLPPENDGGAGDRPGLGATATVVSG